MMVGTMRTRDGRHPVRVGSLLTVAVPALAERMLEDAIRREWALTAGPDGARRSHPGALRQGILEVAVDNSPWLQELTLRTAAIVTALRKRHGSAVLDVRFTLGNDHHNTEVAASRQPARANVEGAQRHLTLAEARLVDAAAGQVLDPALASALKRLVTKDLLARGERSAPAASEQP